MSDEITIHEHDEDCEACVALPQPDTGTPVRAETSALGALTVASVHHPSDRDAYLDWHKAKYPDLWPSDIPDETPGEVFIPVTVSKAGWVESAGIPFKQGELESLPALELSDDPRREVGHDTPIDAKVVATWADGSVKWVHVTFKAPYGGDFVIRDAEEAPTGEPPHAEVGSYHVVGDSGWSELEITHGPLVSTGNFDSSIGDLALYEHNRHYHDGFWRSFLTVRNPLEITESRGQPTCMSFGSPNDRTANIDIQADSPIAVRWEDQNGVQRVSSTAVKLLDGLILRPGEQITFEITPADLSGEQAEDLSHAHSFMISEAYAAFAEPPTCFCEPSRYIESGVFGDLVPVALDSGTDQLIYEMRVQDALRGLWEYRTLPEDVRNPRNWGDHNRDFEGPPSNKKFHNNEYDGYLHALKQGLRYVGLTHSTYDIDGVGERAFLTAEAGIRHFADVDVCHVNSGPLKWMQGAPFQHDKHGGSGENKEHRGSFSPNAGHFAGRGVLAMWYMTGCPVLLDTWKELTANLKYRIEKSLEAPSGADGPDKADLDGEMRAPAQIIGMALDEYRREWSSEWEDLVKDAAWKAMERVYIDPATRGYEWRYKPGFACLLAVALREFDEVFKSETFAGIPYEAALADFIFDTGVTESDGEPHLYYEVSTIPGRPSSSGGMPGAFWGLYAADAFYAITGQRQASDPSDALFRDGCNAWYRGHELGKWPKLLSALGVLGGGQTYLKRRAG